jgi:predicted SAM-dependent methyltransferase
MLNLDVQNMDSIGNEVFDAFIFSHILEHVEDDELALKELYRILAHGGWGIIMVPILLSINTTYEDKNIVSPELRMKHFGLEDHLRIYSKSGFVDKLIKVGFSVKEFSINDFTTHDFYENGLSSKNILYVVEK